MIEKGEKISAQAAKGFNDTWKDSSALGNRIAGFLIEFAKVRGTAGLGKGTLGVPLGQRIANGGINKKLFTSWCHSHDIHNSVSEVLCLEWVKIVNIVGVCRSGGGGGEFGDGNFPVNA